MMKLKIHFAERLLHMHDVLSGHLNQTLTVSP
jgi:hypothetical protein